MPEPQAMLKIKGSKRQYTFTSVHSYKEIMIKLNFYEKYDGNLGPLRVTCAHAKLLCILKISFGPLQYSHIQQLCIADLL